MTRLKGFLVCAAVTFTLAPLVFGCAAETSTTQTEQQTPAERARELSGGGEDVSSGTLRPAMFMSGSACSAHPGGAWACCDTNDDGTVCCIWGKTPGKQDGQTSGC